MHRSLFGKKCKYYYINAAHLNLWHVTALFASVAFVMQFCHNHLPNVKCRLACCIATY